MSDIEDMVRRIVRDELAKATPANDGAEYLSVAEAADFARVSVYTIRRWVKTGELSRHEAGTKLLVRRDELQRLLVGADRTGAVSLDERIRRRFG